LLPVASAMLLLAAAWRIATLRHAGAEDTPQGGRGRLAECVLGFSCGLLNPVTASYFASQLLAGAAPKEAMVIVTLGIGVMAVAVACTSILGLMLSVSLVRSFVRRRLRPIRCAVASLFCCMAFATLLPLTA
jgi:threonine/homoserine/homoserine lactone efflux protein